jgi:hypothetical protein
VCLALSTFAYSGIAENARAATCHGVGKAKTTFRPGTITASELRNTTEWDYNCGTGALQSPVSLTNHYFYWNPLIDATALGANTYYTSLSLPNNLFGNMAATFAATDSYVVNYGDYKYTLHNYVYSTKYDFGNSIRSCWIDGTTSYMPGYTLSCGT